MGVLWVCYGCAMYVCCLLFFVYDFAIWGPGWASVRVQTELATNAKSVPPLAPRPPALKGDRAHTHSQEQGPPLLPTSYVLCMGCPSSLEGGGRSLARGRAKADARETQRGVEGKSAALEPNCGTYARRLALNPSPSDR